MGESRVTSEHTLRVNEVYYTLQGEGRYAGWPMVVVRLHGCGVGCPFCDTKYTWEHARGDDARDNWHSLDNGEGSPTWMDVTVSALLDMITAVAPDCRWILLTGGEPLEQEIRPLLQALPQDYRVNIETSGTSCADETLPLSAHVWLCVSPKRGMPGRRKLDASVMRCASEWKFVIGSAKDLADVGHCISKYAPDMTTRPMISLQPMSQNEKATAICVAECLKNGWHLSLQTHKFVGLS